MLLIEKQVSELFQSIDSGDVQAFKSFLSEDATFRFANSPPVSGREQVGLVVETFLQSLGAVSHQLEEITESPNLLVCQGQVTYTRKDGSTLTVPFCNVFKLRDPDRFEISQYLIYVDISAL